MPRRRQPREIWYEVTRPRIWERDGRRCVSPLEPPICRGKPAIALDVAHIDHIHAGKLGTNEDTNLRTLCVVCHALRADRRHRHLTAKLVAEGILPPDWRALVWDD
mgnify:CR=1 FL=1